MDFRIEWDIDCGNISASNSLPLYCINITRVIIIAMLYTYNTALTIYLSSTLGACMFYGLVRKINVHMLYVSFFSLCVLLTIEMVE